MLDLHPTIAPKSTQLNADDLIGRTLTIKVTKVSLCAEPEQPVALHFEGDDGKPYLPGKSMRRVMVMLWGADGNQYVGRRMTLYRDEKVQFGGQAVGGIRISHMSDIEGTQILTLTASKAKRAPFTVKPLGPETATGAVTIDVPALLDEGRARAAAGNVALAAWWKGLNKAEQVAAKSTLDGELKPLANQFDAKATLAAPEPAQEPTTETVVEPAQEAEPEADERPTTQAADTETAPAPSAAPELDSSASATAASGASQEATSSPTPPAEQSPAGVASAERIDPATAAADPAYYHFVGDRVSAAGQRPFYAPGTVRSGFGMKEHAIRVCRSLDGQGRACTWDGADIDAIVSEAAPEPAPPEAPGGGDPALNVEPEAASDDAFGAPETLDPLTNLDIYQNAIWAAEDWAGLSAAVKALYATPEWKAADKAQRSGLYRMAYERVVEGGPFACSPGTNPTAFAVFVAGCEDGEQIQRTFAAGMVQPWYKNANPTTQQAATRMVLDRVEELKGQ